MGIPKGRASTPGEKRKVIEVLYSLWCACPDQRLGQVLENVRVHECESLDLFYVEDEALTQMLIKHLDMCVKTG